MVTRFFRRNKTILLYGMALAILLFLLKWLEWRFIVYDHAVEVYSGVIAIIFTGLGIWVALKLVRPRTITVKDEAPTLPPSGELAGLSGREREVLQLMAEGLSNQEIADRLYVSLNTIKTHCSRIFEKLEVRRRTQAVQKAKGLGVIR